MKLKLAIIYGHFAGPNNFDPDRLCNSDGFLTGSESYYFNTVRGLAELGHDVTAIFTTTANIASCKSLGGARVQQLKYDAFSPPECDAVLVWNEPDYCRFFTPSTLRICSQQLNDWDYCRPDFNDYVDIFTLPSKDHMRYLSENTSVDSSKCMVLPNSINLETSQSLVGKIERDPYRMVYISSPDRGLHWLLEWFPKLKKRIPKLNLKVYYRVLEWCNKADDNWWRPDIPHVYAFLYRARYIKECFERLGTKGENGVTIVGPVSSTQMAEELSSATLLAYPCDTVRYSEGFSVSILDACANGCMPLISDCDAIGSVYKDIAHIIPGRPGEHKKEWMDTIVKSIEEPTFRNTIVNRSLAFAANQSRQRRAKEWEDLIVSGLKTKIKFKMQTLPNITTIPIKNNPETKAARVEIGDSRMRVSLLFHPDTVREPFSAKSLFSSSRGLTGSEMSMFQTAKFLSRAGHDVSIFSKFENTDGFDGVHCHQYQEWENIYKYQKWHGACSWVMPDPLVGVHPDTFRVMSQQCCGFDEHLPNWESNVDIFAPLSSSHARVLGKGAVVPGTTQVKIDRSKWRIFSNGVDTSKFKPGLKAFGRIIWASSLDRGLHHLLEMFPRIKEQIPHAELHIFYSPYSIEYAAKEYGEGRYAPSPIHIELGRRARYILDILSQNKPGIFMHGGVSRTRMEEEMASASVLAYPLAPVYFTETFGVTVLEACAAGVVPVLCLDDSFGELWGNVGENVPAPIEEHLPEFERKLVATLRDDRKRFNLASKCVDLATKFEWKTVVSQLEKCFLSKGREGLPEVDWNGK